MSSKPPIEYDYIEPLAFGGTLPEPATFVLISIGMVMIRRRNGIK